MGTGSALKRRELSEKLPKMLHVDTVLYFTLLYFTKTHKFPHKMHVFRTKMAYVRSQTLKISPQRPQSDLGVRAK